MKTIPGIDTVRFTMQSAKKLVTTTDKYHFGFFPFVQPYKYFVHAVLSCSSQYVNSSLTRWPFHMSRFAPSMPNAFTLARGKLIVIGVEIHPWLAETNIPPIGLHGPIEPAA